MKQYNQEQINLLTELKNNFYAITSKAQEDFLAKENRFLKVLIRCSNGRFICAIQDLPVFADLIKDHKENYIRDVSVYEKDCQSLIDNIILGRAYNSLIFNK